MSDQPNPTAESVGRAGEEELPEQVRVRMGKLQRLRSRGADPYPLGFPRTATTAEVRDKHQGLPPDAKTGERVGVVGRVILNRDAGKLCFAVIRDAYGEIQLMLSLDKVGPELLAQWKSDVDIGDHVGAEGEVVTSRRGELSVLVDRWTITSKCLRPLPEKYKGLTDPEARVRQRYVDLIVNDDARRNLYVRSDLVRSIRDSLHRRGYVEVETPMLQVQQGGAAARPFVTHIKAYDMDLYLRIAPELYLKRLLVGGLERVFEINRNFRNEGVDATHNPEFTMLEVYEAYGDYNSVARLSREIIQESAERLFGSHIVRHPDGSEYDFGGEWKQIGLYESVSEAVGTEITPETTYAEIRRHAGALGIDVDPLWGPGRLVEEIFEETVVPGLIAPTFVCDFPEETSPLTRAHREIPGLTEKWDLYVYGVELGTGYSELIDPIEQRRRLVAQSLAAARGDAEAMPADEDFLGALEYAMPPTGGMGLGIDRLLMVLTGASSVRDTILFPWVKPRE